MTILGGRASGPIYYPGGTRAQEWINIWREGERPISQWSLPNPKSLPRKFDVEPAHYADKVDTIYAQLKSAKASPISQDHR